MAEQQNQNKNANAKEQDIHQLLKVRREKLSELQTEGRDRSRSQNMIRQLTAQISRIITQNMTERKFPSQDVLCPSVSWVKLPSATSRISRATSSAMYAAMTSVRIPIKTSREWISAISSASRALYSQQRWARSLFMPIP